MKNDTVEATIKAVVPVPNGYAIFLGPREKTIMIHVDLFIGNAITMAINEDKKERPLTHDLIVSMFQGLGIDLERIVISDMRNDTFYARIILRMENELGCKFLEIDARPSDSLVLALQRKRPILVAKNVLDGTEDMTQVLEKISKQDG